MTEKKSAQSHIIGDNHQKQFWTLQLFGWFALSIIAFIAGPLWYGINNIFLDVAVIILQSCIGALTTIPLRIMFKKIWDEGFYFRLIISIICVSMASIVWTYAKMKIYSWIMFNGDSLNIPRDFGGWLYVSVLVMGGWSTFYYGIRYFRQVEIEHEQAERAKSLAQEAHLRELQAESLARNAQLLMLRYQVNPHFLFNTLNAVCGLVGTGRGIEAQTMLIRLSDYFRHTLEYDLRSMTDLKTEIEGLGHYLDVERVRFGDKLNIEIKMDKLSKDALVPSIILQPLFENAIKFSVAESEDISKISFISKIKNERLIIKLIDDGTDNDSSSNFQKGTGTGIKNVRDRLKNHFGDDFSFSAQKTKNSKFEVLIDIPFSNATNTKNNDSVARGGN